MFFSYTDRHNTNNNDFSQLQLKCTKNVHFNKSVVLPKKLFSKDMWFLYLIQTQAHTHIHTTKLWRQDNKNGNFFC